MNDWWEVFEESSSTTEKTFVTCKTGNTLEYNENQNSVFHRAEHEKINKQIESTRSIGTYGTTEFDTELGEWSIYRLQNEPVHVRKHLTSFSDW